LWPCDDFNFGDALYEIAKEAYEFDQGKNEAENNS
jgi:hypothetical protein